MCIAFLFKCDPICHLVINLAKWISYPSQSRVSFPSRERPTKNLTPKIWPFCLTLTCLRWQAVIFTIRSRPKVLTVIWIIIPHLQVALKWIENPNQGHPDMIIRTRSKRWIKWYYKGLTDLFLGFFQTTQQSFTTQDSNGIQYGQFFNLSPCLTLWACFEPHLWHTEGLKLDLNWTKG